MTKNKSLFSGVGDGNRVKSIRLQGDKHTQGKKGKRRTVNVAQAGPNRAPRQPAGARRPEPGPGRRGGGGAAKWESLGTSGPAANQTTAPAQLTPAGAPTGTEGPGWLFPHGTCTLGVSAASSGPGCLVRLLPAQLHLGTGSWGLECSGKFPLAKPQPTMQWLSAIQGSCTKDSDFKATGAPLPLPSRSSPD